jgi:hypothetical protein
VKGTLFRDMMAYSSIEFHCRFRGTPCFHHQHGRISQGNKQRFLFTALKVEAVISFKSSMNFCRSTQHHIQEDSVLFIS